MRRSASPGFALAVLTAIGTVGFIDRIVVNVLVEPLKAEFGLSDAQIGLLGFAFAALQILFGLLFARLAERVRRLSLVAVGVALWSLATAACGLVTSWGQLLAARMAVGVGEAVGLPSNQSVVADYFPPERRATAMSVLLLSPPLGMFIGSAGGGWIGQEWGWRAAFFAAAVPGFVLAAVAFLFVAEPKRGGYDIGDVDRVPPVREIFARLRRLSSARHLVAGSALAALTGFGLTAFIAALLMRRFDFSLVEAGLATGLLASLPAGLSVFGGGWLADRLGRTRPAAYGLVPAVSLALAVPIYFAAMAQDTALALLGLVTLSTLLQYSFLGLTIGTLQNLMHPRMRASTSALLNIVYGFAGGIGPLLVGALSDRIAGGGVDEGRALGAAMAASTLVYLWAAFHYWRASRLVGSDLAAAREGRV